MDKKQYDREWYAKNKDRLRDIKNERNRSYRKIKRKYIIEVLKGSKCLHCGTDDWRVLEFDHREPTTKSFNIADSTKYPFNKIKEEIDKCDILCANCHTIKTIEQRDYYKFE